MEGAGLPAQGKRPGPGPQAQGRRPEIKSIRFSDIFAATTK